jgi:hypothetical protein
VSERWQSVNFPGRLTNSTLAAVEAVRWALDRLS